MAISCPNVAEQLLLQYILGMEDAGAPVMRLYANNLNPSPTGDPEQGTGPQEETSLGDFVETTVAGYAPVTLHSSYWTVETLGSPANTTTAKYSQETFSFTSGAWIFGYYITSDAASSRPDELMWAERFTGAPFKLPVSGGTIAITPRVTLD